MREAQDVDVLTGEEEVRSVDRGSGQGHRSLVLALVVAVGAIALDQLTKAWVVRSLELGACGPAGEGCVELIGSLRLHFVENSGAAFSTGPALGPLFGVIALVMSVFVLNLARTRSDVVGPVVLGAIAGGAVGNLIDRLARAESGFLSGSVVDFIDLQWWPVFNVADAAVVCGVIVYAVLAWRADAESAESGSGSDEATDPDEGVADVADAASGEDVVLADVADADSGEGAVLADVAVDAASGEGAVLADAADRGGAPVADDVRGRR